MTSHLDKVPVSLVKDYKSLTVTYPEEGGTKKEQQAMAFHEHPVLVAFEVGQT